MREHLAQSPIVPTHAIPSPFCSSFERLCYRTCCPKRSETFGGAEATREAAWKRQLFEGPPHRLLKSVDYDPENPKKAHNHIRRIRIRKGDDSGDNPDFDDQHSGGAGIWPCHSCPEVPLCIYHAGCLAPCGYPVFHHCCGAGKMADGAAYVRIRP